jgi:hypothetical protein
VDGHLSLADIAEKFGCRPGALGIHKARHLRRSILRTARGRALASPMNLVEYLENLLHGAQRVRDRAEAKGNHPATLAAIAQLTKIIELIAKLTGQLDSNSQVNILIQQQQSRDNEQLALLANLSFEQKLQLRDLLTLAHSSGDPSNGTATDPGDGRAGTA